MQLRGLVLVALLLPACAEEVLDAPAEEGVLGDAAAADAFPMEASMVIPGPDGRPPTDDGPAVDGNHEDAGERVDAGADAAPLDAATTDAGPLQIVQLTPASAPKGTAATLQVTGEGFLAGATIYFDGVALSTTSGAPGSLAGSVPAASTSVVGFHTVHVENPPFGDASRSSVIYFRATGPAAAPEIVDYDPDNGVAGDAVRIVGKNLLGSGATTIADRSGMMAASGATGTTSEWHGGKLDYVTVTIPSGWTTGALTFANTAGTARGRIFQMGQNYSREAARVVTTSSTYGGYAASQAADNRIPTGWYAASGTCVTSASCTIEPTLRMRFASPHAVGRIALRGNRDYAGYDFLRGRIEVQDSGGNVLWASSRALPAPFFDTAIEITPAVPNASQVFFKSEADDSTGPGLAELEVFAN